MPDVQIVTIDEVKAHLNKTTTDDDAELAEFIDAATPVVEHYAGPVLPATFVERHRTNCRLVLYRTPILSLTSVEPWLTNGTTYNVAELMFDPDTGVVERSNGLPFTGGPFKVTYQAGRIAVPANVRMAALIIVAHMWETQRGRPAKFPTGDAGTYVPGATYSVPRKALELLGERGPVAG